jgi:DNA-binding HxlR family transcriptional regulator
MLTSLKMKPIYIRHLFPLIMTRQLNKKVEFCPVARSLDIVGDRWSLLIVRNAFDGMRRFSEFQRDLGVARSILTDRLRGLVDAEIFEVQPASDGTSYQEYVLTPSGQQLFPLIVALRQWGEEYLFKKGEKHSELIESLSGKQLSLMLPTAADGRIITSQEVSIKKVS